MEMDGSKQQVDEARDILRTFNERSQRWLMYARKRMIFKDEQARAKFVAALEDTIAAMSANRSAQFWIDIREDLERPVAEDLAVKFDAKGKAAWWLAAKLAQGVTDSHVKAHFESRQNLH